MRHCSTSGAPAASTAAAPDDATLATGVSNLTSERTATGVGKAASALLAKHVRTLEVLHSLQRENAKLRLEIRVKAMAETCRLIPQRCTLVFVLALSGACCVCPLYVQYCPSAIAPSAVCVRVRKKAWGGRQLSASSAGRL